MPLLANYCKKNKSRSRADNVSVSNCPCDDSKTCSELALTCTPRDSEDEEPPQCGYDKVALAKTLLGPSLEDAVLKTLEFGKSLVQGNNENELACLPEAVKKKPKNSCKEKNQREKCFDYGMKNIPDCRHEKKRIIFTTNFDDNLPLVRKPPRKLSELSKIRSLDSDLKTTPHSPEKIKKQLEALIQINKDEPPEHAHDWDILSKIPAVPIEMTVMPSMCVYKNPVRMNTSSCDGQSPERSNDEESSSKCAKLRSRLKTMTGIRHAPEFITNALGPTLDVSIMENIKMMRDLFKNENGRGEGIPPYTGGSMRSSGVSFADSSSTKGESCNQRSSTSKSCSKKSEDSLACRIKEAEERVQELKEKQCCLEKRIEMEEREWACKRQAFEEEERRMCEMRACAQNVEFRDCSTQRSQADFSDSKLEALRQRISCEEEKLSRLKDQYECYKRELCIAKSRCDAIKRNKCILDAWDIIASRVCHTRLPSFSRSYALERKELNMAESFGTLHCCFPPPFPVNEAQEDLTKSGNQTQWGESATRSNENVCAECVPMAKNCLMSQGDIPYPIQRDITCGLHQVLKSCCCKPAEPIACTSDDELMKKCNRIKQQRKSPCRSKSETRAECTKNPSKIVKVLWAVTRINIFQDNCRTYEVMDATTTPPACTPMKTEGIFVVRNSGGAGCHQSRPRKKCTINISKK